MYKIEQLVLKIFFFEIHYFEETVQHSNNISEENQMRQLICVGPTDNRVTFVTWSGRA